MQTFLLNTREYQSTMSGDPFAEENATVEAAHEAFFSDNFLFIDGEEQEYRTITPAENQEISLFQARIETTPSCVEGGSATLNIDPVAIQASGRKVTVESLSESKDSRWYNSSVGGDSYTDPLPETSIGYAIYTQHDTFSSWETWLACLAKDYSSALAIASWLTHNPGGNTFVEHRQALTGRTTTEGVDWSQDDVLDSFGSPDGKCAITGDDTTDLQEVHLPYYVLPYLDNTPETYTRIPNFPYVIPEFKTTVKSDLYESYDCLNNTPPIQRRKPGVYVIDETLRELVSDISTTSVEPTYTKWQ